jgi:hypothetical protein
VHCAAHESWGFGAFADGVAERRWMWIIGVAVCEGIDGVFRRTLIPSEAETARSAGTTVEKTNEVPLIR